MKQIILIIAIASFFIACNNQAKEEAKQQPEKVVMTKEDSLKLSKNIKEVA